VQARLKAQVEMQASGYQKMSLLEKLRECLAKNSDLNGAAFRASGLAHPATYARHFGSVTAAYAAAGRDSVTSSGTPKAIARIGKRFTADVFDLLRAETPSARLDLRRNLIYINAAAVKVRVAGVYVTKGGESYWYVSRLKNNRTLSLWLLLLRMRPGSNTGLDFWLFPPCVHATFSGRLSTKWLTESEAYRISTALELKGKLLGIGRLPDTDVVL
jgi:hypothetical protein